MCVHTWKSSGRGGTSAVWPVQSAGASSAVAVVVLVMRLLDPDPDPHPHLSMWIRIRNTEKFSIIFVWIRKDYLG